MAVSKAQQAAVNRYMKSNYDRVNLTMPKGKKETIQAHAQSRGESANAFINRAIDEAMERDNAEDEADSLSLLREYENDPAPEKNQAFSLEDCKREWGLSEPRSESL